MGIILEAYGDYLKNVPQTYGSGRDPPPLLEDFHKKNTFFITSLGSRGVDGRLQVPLL